MKLSDYAKQMGVRYETAWRWYRDGKIQGRRVGPRTIIITVMLTWVDSVSGFGSCPLGVGLLGESARGTVAERYDVRRNTARLADIFHHRAERAGTA